LRELLEARRRLGGRCGLCWRYGARESFASFAHHGFVTGDDYGGRDELGVDVPRLRESFCAGIGRWGRPGEGRGGLVLRDRTG